MPVLTIPASQVSVESTFSVLNFLYNSKRTQMSPNCLEKLLFLKENGRSSQEDEGNESEENLVHD